MFNFRHRKNRRNNKLVINEVIGLLIYAPEDLLLFVDFNVIKWYINIVSIRNIRTQNKGGE